MQYHVWHDRKEFPGLSDEEVKTYFRGWVDTVSCPWYLVEDYVAANKGKRRVRRPTKIPAAAVDKDSEAEGQDEGDVLSESVHTSEEEEKNGKLGVINADER